jgi:serine/threonine protein phosphatase PrpC
MGRIMESNRSLEEMGAQLLQAALDNGGHDNITAVLIRHAPAER